jgi:hypothetical protein
VAQQESIAGIIASLRPVEREVLTLVYWDQLSTVPSGARPWHVLVRSRHHQSCGPGTNWFCRSLLESHLFWLGTAPLAHQRILTSTPFSWPRPVVWVRLHQRDRLAVGVGPHSSSGSGHVIDPVTKRSFGVDSPPSSDRSTFIGTTPAGGTVDVEQDDRLSLTGAPYRGEPNRNGRPSL